MRKSRKMKSAVLAIAAVLLLGTGGTFAWTSISQRALNEGAMVATPGGRVHDDYEGFDNIIPKNGGEVNKDIYAENYSNKPIYVRIKLTEYMETGEGAGQYTVESPDNTMTPTADNKATVLANAGLDNATMNDRSTWPAYLPGGTLSNGSASDLRKYITWNLGDTNTDRKVYMPTFNQNNQNLESDVTGEGIEELTWTKNGNYDTTSKTLDGTQNEWTLGEEHTSDLRKYDDKTSQEVTTPGETHTAVATVDPAYNGYMTMTEWQAAGNPTGNFWVHDNDGWAYWANPLAGHTATSLLLNKLDVNFTQDDMYYAINVVSDFATADDLSQWTGVSTAAQGLLDKIK